MIAILLAVGRFLLGNWRWLVPLVLLVGIGLDDGRQRFRVAARDVIIAQKDTAIAGMQAQQAANIAAAEKKVRERLQAEIDNNNKLVADLLKKAAELQEKANAAEAALAGITVTPTPEGCPEPMGLPVMRALIDGLPDR